MSANAQDKDRETDSWLNAVFAAASGPVVDMTFAGRILARIRKRQRIRSGVIFGSIICAAALTLWQISGLAATVPVFDANILAIPDWFSTSSYSPLVALFLLAALTLLMVTEDA